MLAAEAFLHLAEPAEAWQKASGHLLHAPGSRGNRLKSTFEGRILRTVQKVVFLLTLILSRDVPQPVAGLLARKT